ncbi:hypothetical protein [Virgisporangium aurantiacum]|uniref:Uncharacterized protein n=1 Tax=Virgisporangium aurantiacum TaxID=175570 RepID=A0A8J3ZIC2_9ACTN|nr:hypothetical protein [Virgisporangium aurantiacum]GIJ62460.1 hypothetical protein Vau01_099760 [Virgisporangium aurantiacum]
MSTRENFALELTGIDVEPLELVADRIPLSLDSVSGAQATAELAASCLYGCSCCVSCCCCCC